MATKYLMLLGNKLLMVFKKYLESKEISTSEFINDLLDEIITENAEEFIGNMEQAIKEGRIKVSELDPDLRDGYKELKELFLESKIRGKKFEIPKNF
jgi:hypothetical protein